MDSLGSTTAAVLKQWLGCILSFVLLCRAADADQKHTPPRNSPKALTTPTALPTPALILNSAENFETVARLQERPGNLTIGGDGRMFVSMHPMAPTAFRVAELLPDGSLKPYPPALHEGGGTKERLQLGPVLGLRMAASGVLWMLDLGESKNNKPARLIGWNTKKEQLERVLYLPVPVARGNSFLQDFVLDPNAPFAYVADLGRADIVGVSDPAIITVNLETGVAWRALENHYSLNPDGGDLVISGNPLLTPDGHGGLVRPSIGINGITIDAKGEWVYFGALNGRSLFRLPTTSLRDSAVSSIQLAEKVVRYGDKPPSDGIGIDQQGNVYSTDINQSGIGVTQPDGLYHVLFQDSEVLAWPDAFAYGPDGYYYVVVNQLHRLPLFNGGQDGSVPPFRIVRFRPLAPGMIGR